MNIPSAPGAARATPRRGALALLLGVVTAAVLAAAAPRLPHLAETATLVPTDDPAIALDREITADFGMANPVVWVIEARTGTVWTPAMLSRIEAFTREVFTLPGVIADDVIGLASPNIRDVRVTEDTMEPVYLMGEAPTSAEGVAALRRRVDTDPNFRGTLVTTDGRAAMVVANFRTGIDLQQHRHGGRRAARPLPRCGDDGVRRRRTGVRGARPARRTTRRGGVRAARRRLRDGCRVEWWVARSGSGDARCDAGGVVDDRRHGGARRRGAAVDAVRDRGGEAGGGGRGDVARALARACRGVRRACRGVHGPRGGRRRAGGSAGGGRRDWQCRRDTGRARRTDADRLHADDTAAPRWPRLVGLAVLLAALPGTLRLHASFGLFGYGARYLPAAAAADLEGMRRHFPPPTTLAVRFRGGPGFLESPSVLQAIDAMAAAVRQDPAVVRVLSLADLVKLVNRAFNDARDEFRVIPAERALVARYLTLGYSPQFRQFADRGYTQAALWVYLATDDAAAIERVVATLKGQRNTPALADVEVSLVGGEAATVLASVDVARRLFAGAVVMVLLMAATAAVLRG